MSNKRKPDEGQSYGLLAINHPLFIIAVRITPRDDKIAAVWQGFNCYYPVTYQPVAGVLQSNNVSSIHFNRINILYPKSVAIMQSRLHTGAFNTRRAVAETYGARLHYYEQGRDNNQNN